MSSIVTTVPTGTLPDWCIQLPWFGAFNKPQQCANSTRGTQESDYDTICCDGMIIDTKKSIYEGGPINIEDLMCCRLDGPQQGGLHPLPVGKPTTCESGTPVPLTSLAATNTENAQNFLVSYTSVPFGEPSFNLTQTPYCLWAYTKSGVAMKTTTLPAADITPLTSSESELPTLGSSGSTSASPSASEAQTRQISPATPTTQATQTNRDSSSRTTTAENTASSSGSAASSTRTFSSSDFSGMLCALAIGLWGPFY